MRISITDKFLWDVYNFLSNANEAAHPLLRHRPSIYMFIPGSENPIYVKYRKEKGRKEFNKIIYYLKTRGYIKAKNLKNNKAVILTKEGISKALKASFKLSQREKRKDGKWIMIAFDIPQKNKKARALLRSILCNLGYKIFQQSVWVSPYDVSDKTEKLLQLHSLDKYVKIFLIEEI